MNAGKRMLAVGGLLVLLTACGQDAPAGPPTVRYGQDPCAGCGMIISDDRFAAAWVDPAGEAAPRLFDDGGGMGA